MKKITLLLLLLIIASTFMMLFARSVIAQSLSPPSVSIPSGWELKQQTAYPNDRGDHDPQGAGMVEYDNPITYDFVMIYYENNNGVTYTSADLQAEAESIYQRDIGEPFTDSGVTTFAGEPAGYVRVYNSTLDTYELQLVFVKGVYFLDIYSYYSASSQAKVYSLIDSISPSNGGSAGNYLLFIVAGAIVAVIIVIVLVLIFLKKRSGTPKNHPQVIPNTQFIGQRTMTGSEARVATGFYALDSLLHGGFSDKSSVMLLSTSFEERDILVKSFLETGARNGEVVFCVTGDPGFATAMAEQFPLNFFLLICNPRVNMGTPGSANIVVLNGTVNFTNISIAITKVINNLAPSAKKSKRIVISILSDAVLYNGVLQTRKWLTELLPELKSAGFTTLAMMDPKMHTQDDLYKIVSLFDGEIDIQERQMKKLERFLKIARMGNQDYDKGETVLTQK